MFVGGGAMHLNESASNHANIRYVACLHEQAAAIAAESYARCKNDIGVTIVTTGPGATNTITAIAAAWIESTPLLVISGQVKTSDLMTGTHVRQMGVQEVDIVSIVKPITKYAVMVTKPEDIRYELEKAVFNLKNGRPGPVLLDIPLNIQASQINPEELKPFHSEPTASVPDPAKLEELKHLLSAAKRPVIYTGAGVAISNCTDELISLAESLNIPLLTTWNGIDIIWEEHPLYMGRPGAIGQRHANFILQNSDLLICIGTRLASLQTGFNYEAFARNAKLVMVDIDSAELCKQKLHPYLTFCCDAKEFVNALSASLPPVTNHDEWIKTCLKLRAKYPVSNPAWNENDKPVNSYLLIEQLSSLMTDEDVYCGGRAGTCVDTVIQAFKVKKGQRVIATKGLSSMGYGLPAALGAAFAFPGRRIICCNGDGGFVMNIQDLATIKYHNLPIKFFILDNKGYATIYATQTNVFDRHFVGCTEQSGLHIGNIRKIAEAYDIKTFRINKNSEIESTVSDALNYPGPVVCMVDVSIQQPILPRQANYKTPEGQMASRPLEDMRPLLDREELNAIMSISNPEN